MRQRGLLAGRAANPLPGQAVNRWRADNSVRWLRVDTVAARA